MLDQLKANIRYRHIMIALHVLIWSMLLLLPYFVSTADNDYRVGPIPGLFFTLAGFIHIIIFYGNAYLLYPRLLNWRYWWLYIIAAVLLLVGSFQLKYHIMAAWFPELLKNVGAYKFVFGPSVVVFIISIIYRKIIDRARFEKEQKEKQAAQLSTELKFLRSQISPHFLFNVLTNLVSLARKKSDRLEPSLIKLSDLMRYMLYDSQGKKVAVTKEITYLNSYIELQKLRFGNDVKIDNNIVLDESADHCNIEPMLLIPFVENAFKHGVGLKDPWINIKLTVKDGGLLFEVLNQYDNEPGESKDDSSGIGLLNVKSRLDLLYKNNYTLTINNDDNLFHITLTLKLT
ncbi:histidine kinase [Chitinophaga sp. MM2321]|uniref:sensor histidine kinase n=1 Tax=Chitinophaga sp. MM2321 TaxID=3137178 RepID=UPI0032D57010